MGASIKLLWIELSVFECGYVTKRHTHDYYHMVYCIGGEGSFIIDQQEYELKPDMFILVPPQTEHEMVKVEVDEFSVVEIKFVINDTYIKERLNLQNPLFTGDQFTRTIVDYVETNGRSRMPQYIQNTECFFTTLLISLIKENVLPSQANYSLIDTTGFSEVVINIIDYIEKNYMNHVSLEAIAVHVGYNRNYICSVFKREVNITIVEYLNFVRIRNACTNLSYFDGDINQICTRVGFSNINHFNRTFKKLVSIPPGKFRKMIPLDIYENTNNENHMLTPFDFQMLTMSEIFGTINNLIIDDNSL